MTPSSLPLYTLDDVTCRIDGRRILHGLSFTLEAGRIHGLVGANGSGKSTLMRLLARQRRADGGTIRVLGDDIGTATDRAFARTVAYMPQFTPPCDGMSVRELVSLGRFPWHGAFGRVGDGDRAKVEAALAQTGLSGLADRPVDALSGGERQRAWLAMMVAQDTHCLLLDEPTSALDIAHQVEMLRLVRRLSRQCGVGAVVVLHDINLAARLCDDIVALRDGRVVAHGTPAEIMTPEVLAAVYGIAMGILAHPASGEPIGYVQSV